MYAVGADEANHNGANGTRHIARVSKGIGHGQNACAQGTFQQMEKGLPVATVEVIILVPLCVISLLYLRCRMRHIAMLVGIVVGIFSRLVVVAATLLGQL